MVVCLSLGILNLSASSKRTLLIPEHSMTKRSRQVYIFCGPGLIFYFKDRFHLKDRCITQKSASRHYYMCVGDRKQ